jgi:hypothetical protein
MKSAVREAETETVQEAPACLSCGSPRMDWTEAGWKCQDCGAVELVSVEQRKVA